MARKNNIFTQVPVQRVKRNLFDLSHEVKTTGKFGYLYPVFIADVVPGDTIRHDVRSFARFAPMLAPILHRCDLSVHTFHVPNRIICNVWQDFITGGQDGTDATVLPFCTPRGMLDGTVPNVMKKGGLWDHLGLPVWEGSDPSSPTEVSNTEQISVLPFRAYYKVWNDFFRDPNFDVEVDLDLDGVGDRSAQLRSEMFNSSSATAGLGRRAFEKDYFTSCLENAQRGAQVLIPMEATPNYFDQSDVVTDALGTSGTLALDASFNGVTGRAGLELAGGSTAARIENIESIENTSITINDLRRSFAVQRWLENNARGGYRYVEQIQNHFDVTVPDFRLQRAEYLGGGKQAIQISEVLAAAGGEDQPPVGDMAGHGISAGRSNRYTYRVKEHGWVITILSLTYRTAYQQGLPRMWSRRSKFDFAWPELANLGEQAVLSKEVFCSLLASEDDNNQATFGYIPRYAEYKYYPDQVRGDFRDTLAFWHLGRIFTSRPTLDQEFTTIPSNSPDYEEPADRIFAVQDGTDYVWMQLYHHITVKRPLPYFGVPSGL